MELDEQKIQEAVVHQTVEELVHKFYRDEDLRDQIRHLVTEVVRGAIDSQVKETVLNGINVLTFPHTNSFGERKGQERTLREYIDELIQQFLKEQVDSEGCVKTSAYGDKESRIKWLIRKELGKHLDQSIKGAMAQIRNQMSATIAEIVKAEIDKAVGKLR